MPIPHQPSACPALLPAHQVRSLFSAALSDMYRAEVPLYGDLLDLVADVNEAACRHDASLAARVARTGETARLEVERHGAIRLGTAAELRTMRRVLAVLGMFPVGYYDLSVAGLPVHSTAFRPVDPDALQRNPLRLFTSLLRLELVADPALREEAAALLAARRIFTPRLLALTARHEDVGGLTQTEAREFVAEALETFRWHGDAPVTTGQYRRLHAAHPLLADVACFRGPHINHLTPRTLDIDAAQAEMVARGMQAKEVVEGPPPRQHPILLRQTSFLALREPTRFADGDDGAHTARFGEIEQRGMALTRRGRALYDKLLAAARRADPALGPTSVCEAFRAFPDDLTTLRHEGLAFFRYACNAQATELPGADLETLIATGAVSAQPIVYEDFLPVSAAGIFRSNLGKQVAAGYDAAPAQQQFEEALGCPVLDEIALYERQQRESLQQVEQRFGLELTA
jgi:uncharacterized glyoxalase superfamily metalloenzyme YdcJ